MSAESLVLFRRARADVYDGAFDPIHLEAWIIQIERILKVAHIPR